MRESLPLDDPRTRRALDDLHDRAVNFELGDPARFSPRQGWRVDDYCRTLPEEPPGLPLSNGSWAAARRLVHDYDFADPSIVRAVYRPESPLAERDMLLEGRFLFLRFRFGCRVGGVIDEMRTIEGRRARVWGWNYRTLQGHLEMGQMDFEVWKWLDTGAVEFRIHSFSRPAHIANPLVRLGFWLFGRLVQRRFAQRASERMAELTLAELGRDASARGPDSRIGNHPLS